MYKGVNSRTNGNGDSGATVKVRVIAAKAKNAEIGVNSKSESTICLFMMNDYYRLRGLISITFSMVFQYKYKVVLKTLGNRFKNQFLRLIWRMILNGLVSVLR